MIGAKHNSISACHRAAGDEAVWGWLKGIHSTLLIIDEEAYTHAHPSTCLLQCILVACMLRKCRQSVETEEIDEPDGDPRV